MSAQQALRNARARVRALEAALAVANIKLQEATAENGALRGELHGARLASTGLRTIVDDTHRRFELADNERGKLVDVLHVLVACKHRPLELIEPKAPR